MIDIDKLNILIDRTIENSKNKWMKTIQEYVTLKIENSELKQLIQLEKRIEKLEKQLNKPKPIWDDELGGLYK